MRSDLSARLMVKCSEDSGYTEEARIETEIGCTFPLDCSQTEGRCRDYQTLDG